MFDTWTKNAEVHFWLLSSNTYKTFASRAHYFRYIILSMKLIYTKIRYYIKLDIYVYIYTGERYIERRNVCGLLCSAHSDLQCTNLHTFVISRCSPQSLSGKKLLFRLDYAFYSLSSRTGFARCIHRRHLFLICIDVRVGRWKFAATQAVTRWPCVYHVFLPIVLNLRVSRLFFFRSLINGSVRLDSRL